MTLKNGSSGELVKKVQAVLGLKQDGSFGPATESAIKAWQTKNGLTADGIVGDQTLTKMGITIPSANLSGPVNFDLLKGKIPDEILALLPAGFKKYGIDTAIRATHFIAQISHESGGFTIKTETLYYTTPARIVKIWPSRFNLDGSGGKKNANDYIKDEQKLSEAVYGNRKELGNDKPGDGFRFRGGGFLQLTGKEAYQGYAKYLGKTVGETADLLRSDNFYALDAALWEYCINKKLNAVADQGASEPVLERITKSVNGGLIGLDERREYFNKFYETLVA